MEKPAVLKRNDTIRFQRSFLIVGNQQNCLSVLTVG